MSKQPEVKQDIKQIKQFAGLLLPDECPEGSVAHLWSLPSKKCHWPKNAEEFVAAAVKMDNDGEDVYVGVSLRKVGLGVLTRGGAEDCIYALGTGIDIDVGVSGHAGGKKRFDKVEDAIDCAMSAVSLEPTMIINSGGGLHLWWLYREPYEMFTAEDRNLASNVAREWNMRICEAARKAGGYSVDSTFDLPRVLRVPGTRNRKIPEAPRPVNFIDVGEHRRYDPKDMADAMSLDPSTLAARTVQETVILGDRISLDSTAQPNFEKMHALMENDQWFGLYLKRDPACTKKLKEDSASAYDLALANITARASWSDQEITDLLIYNRRRHGNDLKLRERYYAMTIAKARQGHDGTIASIKLVEGKKDRDDAEALDEMQIITSPSEMKEEAFAMIRKVTGVDVIRIVSTGKDPARYRVVVRGGELLHVESTTLLLRQDTWLNLAIESKAQVPPDLLNAKNWRRLVGLMGPLIEYEKDPDGIHNALCEYLERAVRCDDGDQSQRGTAISNRRPLIQEDGHPAVHLATFSRWLLDQGRRIELPALKSRLRAAGFAAKTLAFRDGTNSSRTYWISSKTYAEILSEFGNPDAELEAQS